MRRNGGSNSAGMFDQMVMLAQLRIINCWLEGDYEGAVERDALFRERILFARARVVQAGC
jgi:hypothetical protein